MVIQITLRWLGIAALGLLLAASAGAIPVVAPPSAFDGSETLIDFSTLSQDEEVTTKFVGLSVSGGLFGDTFGYHACGDTCSSVEF